MCYRNTAPTDEKVDKLTDSDSEQQPTDSCSAPPVTCSCCLGNSTDEEHSENTGQLPIRPRHAQ